jgi:hypothetical protein
VIGGDDGRVLQTIRWPTHQRQTPFLAWLQILYWLLSLSRRPAPNIIPLIALRLVLLTNRGLHYLRFLFANLLLLALLCLEAERLQKVSIR